MQLPRHARSVPRALIFILLLAFALRLLVARHNLDTPLADDEEDYLNRATRIAADISSDRTAFRPPLYSYALAVVVTTIGSERFVLNTYQALLDVGSVALIYTLTRLAFRRVGVAVLASALFAISPTAIGLTGAVLSDTQFVFLFLLGLVALLRALKYQQWVLAGLAGIFFALAALTREVAFYFGLLVVPVWWIVFTRVPLRARLVPSAVFVLGMLLVMMPWVIRNAVVEQRFLLISTSGEFNFARDNVRIAILMGKEKVTSPLRINQRFFAEFEAQAPNDRAAYAYGRGLEAIRQTGLYWLGYKAQALGEFWNPYHFEKTNLGIANLPPEWLPLISSLISAFLIAFMLFATLGVLAAPDTPIKLLIALFLLYSLVIFMLTHYQLRYRYPLHVLVMPYAAYGIWLMREMVRQRTYKLPEFPLPRLGLTLATVLVFVPLIFGANA